MPKRKATHIVVHVVVVPMHKIPHPFPIDMLRRDSCVPASEIDAARISRTLSMESATDATTPIHSLRFYPAGGNPMPTVGRWESFGWRVMAVVEAEAHLRRNGGPSFLDQYGHAI
jgi:hypothetical protein